MNWPLFCSTFVLIFLAELGDKTQLAVMSQSAGSTSKWTVFVAGALALAASTAIGVLAGGVLRRFVPDDRFIKVAGGLLFLVFGVLMLREALQPKPGLKPFAGKETHAFKGWIGRFVIQQASIFERAAFEDYTTLAACSLDPREKAVFERLAMEEEWHHQAMLGAIAVGAENDIPFTSDLARDLPELDDLMHDAAKASEAVEHAIEHELSMARFYRVLSEKSTLPRLRDTFAALAVSEEGHARRLMALRRPPGDMAQKP